MSWLHTRLVLPFAEPERYAGLAGRLRALDRFEALSPARQQEEHNSYVTKLLCDAYRTTPYYRRIFCESGFGPEDWRPGDSIRLPLLTKSILRGVGEDMLSRDCPATNLRPSQTGGTTGLPVRIWRDVESLRQKVAMQIHMEKQAGYAPGDSVLMIWGADRDLELNPTWKWRFYQQILMRQHVAPVGNMNEAVFARFYEKLQKYRPKVIYGYSACIARFAEYVAQQSGGYRSPSTIIATAEPLSDTDRNVIQAVFGTKVTEFYGSRDIGMVASECRFHDGLHFHPAACHLELAPQGNTPEGPLYKLVLTDLLNTAMPMLRYDTDDCVLISRAPCKCGSWYPRVRRIVGRTVDNFVMKDGTCVPGISLTIQITKLRDNLKQITGIQFVQKEFDLIQLRYSAHGEEQPIARELQQLCDIAGQLFPSKMFWIHTRVPEIQRESSGKLRFTISEVAAKN